MFIDLICILLLLLAIFKGFSKGLIVAFFSFAALIIGLAAALKLSATVANYLREQMKTDSKWLPVLSFIVVFIGVTLLVQWGAKLLKGITNIAFLGWLDSIGGVFMYIFLYMMIFSVLLFFGHQLHLVSPETEAVSKSYPYIEPWGPWVINGMGRVIPFFKDIFSDLQRFFEKVVR